jgi:hypothetical protein
MAGLHIRRAVAEYLDDPGGHYKLAAVIMSLSVEAWVKSYLSQATVTDLVQRKKSRCDGVQPRKRNT